MSDSAELLTQIQICRRYGFSDETWRRWRFAGRVPEAVVLPSGRLRWRRVEIEAFMRTPSEAPERRRYFQAVARRAGRHSDTVTLEPSRFQSKS